MNTVGAHLALAGGRTQPPCVVGPFSAIRLARRVRLRTGRGTDQLQ